MASERNNHLRYIYQMRTSVSFGVSAIARVLCSAS
ncbi:hypothetical protein PITC_049370 [Penicillium italicum]|uniref:Uncharacterized protein n=1 Tax=Penicillium italicum TaxID=40296 RepID=A0A0A2KGS3_PENIT|nr:hypothetical protein PITC_049370 [Penicillium italicum]